MPTDHDSDETRKTRPVRGAIAFALWSAAYGAVMWFIGKSPHFPGWYVSTVLVMAAAYAVFGWLLYVVFSGRVRLKLNW